LKTKFYLNTSEEKFSTKRSAKGNKLSTKQSLDRTLFQQIPKETSTKEYLKKHARQECSEDESLRKKHLKKIITSENLSKQICCPK